MVVLSQDVAVRYDATFFCENAMAQKKPEPVMGRKTRIEMNQERYSRAKTRKPKP